MPDPEQRLQDLASEINAAVVAMTEELPPDMPVDTLIAACGSILTACFKTRHADEQERLREAGKFMRVLLNTLREETRQ